ncbi:DUF7344 domain-containing protein [Natronobacterium haloterrestre]
MGYQQSNQSSKVDKLLTALSNNHCRNMLFYLCESSEEVASVDELASVVCQQGHGTEEQVAIQLHHSTLPRLAAAGVIEYDPRNRTVRQWDDPMLEALLEGVSEGLSKSVDT